MSKMVCCIFQIINADVVKYDANIDSQVLISRHCNTVEPFVFC